MPDQRVSFRIAVPGLSNVAIGCQQPASYHKPGSRHPRSQPRRLVRKAHLVHAEHIANRVAVAVQDHYRHGLFLLKRFELLVELSDLVLQIVRGRWSVVLHQ